MRLRPIALPAAYLALAVVASAGPPARLQATIKGLLVMEHQNGNIAGTASQMNATAVNDGTSGLTVKFNQDVGEQMDLATSEVLKFISVRHHDHLPAGYRIELSFADKYSPKDGPSAAVASALLVDSIISNNEIDPNFAVTGDMNADGQVRPIGGVIAKVRGAARKGCTVVAIPKNNEDSVSDGYIIDGVRDLKTIQIFSIGTFDEALALGSKNRAADLGTALAEFATVQDAIGRNEQFLYNPKVQEKLRTVIKLAPNHLSAKYLLLHGLKRGPRQLSLSGSLTAIGTADTAFAAMLRDGSFTESSGNNDVLFKFEGEMARLKPVLDKRTVLYCDSYLLLAQYVRGIRDKRVYTPQMERELKAAVKRVENQRAAVMSDPEVSAELMDAE